MRLSWQLSEFDGLLREVQSQINADCSPRTLGIRALINASAQHMQDDLQEFRMSIQQLKSILDGPATRGKLFSLRFRHILTESKVTQYQQLISSYSGTLTLSLALISNAKLEQLSKQNSTAFLYSNQDTPKRPPPARNVLNYVGNSNIRGLRLPFGVTASLNTVFHGHGHRKSGQRSSLNYYLTFIPPRWLSSLILQWEFRFHHADHSFPALGVSLSPIRYNSHPRLVKAIKSCNALDLQELFRCGIARADDYLLLRGRPTLLLEAIAQRSGSCNPDSVLDSYKCLLIEEPCTDGVNLASSHAQILINLAKSSSCRLNSALDAFCSHAGNVFWYPYSETVSGGAGRGTENTILSLITRHGSGIACLETFIFRQSEPWTMEDLSNIDRWLIGVLASVSPTFQVSLERYLQSYQCIFATTENSRSSLKPLELSTIVSEVVHAPNKARIEFFRILAKWGTKEMLQPFLSTGIVDLEESAANAMFPWLRLSYLSKAVRWGNVDAFEYLLSLGACPIRGLTYMSRFPWIFPQGTENAQEQIRSMVLKMAGHALSRNTNSLIDDEGMTDHDLLLALLLRTSHLRKYSQQVTDQLIERFVGHRIHQIVDSSDTVVTMYILVILVLNLPCTLRDFLNWTDSSRAKFCSTGNRTSKRRAFCPFDSIALTFEGSSVVLKCHPSINTFSWVSLAIELALPECLEVLLEPWVPAEPKSSVGATGGSSDLLETRRYAKCIRALKGSFSENNAVQEQGKYPRKAIELYTWPCQIPQRSVEQSEDEHIAKILKEGIQKLERVLTLDYINGLGEACDRELSDNVGAARTDVAPKIAKGKQSLVARFMTTAAQLIQLQVWEIILLVFFYIISVVLVVLAYIITEL
ncbi:hypothetical protein K469DRAFT_710266, partial [Zopfia rhizophila CBS 207.26]